MHRKKLMTLPPPKFKSNRYTELKPLGKGGMGSIYRAVDSLLNKSVAVKILASESWTEAQFVRFQREAQALGKLSHPNIAAIFDFGVDEGRAPYMVLELIDGTDLESYLSENEFPEEWVLPVAQQVLAALDHAHAKGIVHRDVKPANIMLQFDGSIVRVKLVDFGIAKFVDSEEQLRSLTEKGIVIGSPYYLSPEQVTHAPVTARSDIYSFGCVLFALLTGHPPFRGGSALETTQLHLNEPPPRLSNLSRLKMFDTEKLENVIDKCLAKNANARLDSCQAVLAELSRCAIEEDVEHKRPFDKKLVSPVVSRRLARKLSPLGIGIIATIIIGVVCVYIRWLNFSDERQLPEVKELVGWRKTARQDYTRRESFDKQKLYWEIQGKSDAEVLASPNNVNVVRDLRIENASDFSGAAFKSLRCKDTLAILRLNNCPNLSPKAIAELSQFKKLQEIDYSENDFPDLQVLEAFSKAVPGITGLALRNCRVNKEVALGICKFPHLENLNLSSAQSTEEALEVLGTLEHLSSLNVVQNVSTTGKFLENAKFNHTMKYLDLSKCASLAVEGVAALRKYDALDRLDLGSMKVTNEMLEKLESIPHLKALSLKEGSIDAQCCKYIGKLPELVELNLSETDIADGDLVELYQLRNLQTIDLKDTCVAESGRARLQEKMPSLKILFAAGSEAPKVNTFREGSVAMFEQIGARVNRNQFVLPERAEKNVSPSQYDDLDARELHATGATVELAANRPILDALAKNKNTTLILLEEANDNTFARLSAFDRLSCLIIDRSTGFTGGGFDSLSCPRTLIKLTIHDCPRFKPAALKSLKRFEKLESLEVDDLAIHAGTLKLLSEIPISSLQLNESRFDKNALPELASLVNLTELQLQRSNIMDSDLRFFYGLNNLFTLNLSGCQLSPEALEALKTKLPHTTIIFNR